jgi:FKBP-type peptidyl-prolyl cis-trans isomerase
MISSSRIALASAALLLSACANSASSAEEGALTTFEDKAAYAIGVNLGKQLAQDSADVDTALLLRGLQEALAGKELLLTDQEIGNTLQQFQQQLMQKRQARMESEGATNLEAGKKFLAENAQREGVQTTASGLQYEVVKEGDGAKPSATDTVTVHYHGTTLEGTVFDSSVDRGEPVSFPLNQVIAGWTEGLQLMATGSKYKFFIPAALGYGAQSPPGAKFGPNATLVFDVELLSIQSP